MNDADATRISRRISPEADGSGAIDPPPFFTRLIVFYAASRVAEIVPAARGEGSASATFLRQRNLIVIPHCYRERYGFVRELRCSRWRSKELEREEAIQFVASFFVGDLSGGEIRS